MTIYFSKDEFILLNHILNDFAYAISINKMHGNELPFFYQKDVFLHLQEKIINNGLYNGIYVEPSERLTEEQIAEVDTFIETLKQQGITEEQLEQVYREFFF